MYVNGNFTEHREQWQKERQRHCEEVYTDQHDTREVQEQIIEYFKKKGDRQFTDDEKRAEITVDLVLRGSKFVGDCETGVLAKTRRRTKEGQ